MGRSRANTLEHPSGYVQDPDAQELTPEARSATEAAEKGEGSRDRSPILPGGASFGGGDEGIWDMAKKWGKVAGEKAISLQDAAWKQLGEGK